MERLTTDKEAQAIVRAWREHGLPPGAGVSRFRSKQARLVVETWLKAQGFKQDKKYSLRWHPPWRLSLQHHAEEKRWTGDEGRPYLGDGGPPEGGDVGGGPCLFGFELPIKPPGLRVEVTERQVHWQWQVPGGWQKCFYDAPLPAIGVVLLTEAAKSKQTFKRVREDVSRYEDEVLGRREQTAAVFDPLRERFVFCAAEVARRKAAGALSPKRADAALRFLWKIGWSPRLRSEYGDLYLGYRPPSEWWPPEGAGFKWYEDKRGFFTRKAHATWHIEIYGGDTTEHGQRRLWRISQQGLLDPEVRLGGELIRRPGRGKTPARITGSALFAAKDGPGEATAVWKRLLARYTGATPG